MNYLLPCPACGQKTTVSAAQAGQSLRCGCGQSWEVPTMRDLRQLEPAGDAERPQANWNRRKGLVFLGCVIMAACAALGGWYYSKLPRSVDPSEVRAEIDATEPAATFLRVHAWQQIGLSDSDPGKLAHLETDPGKLVHEPLKDLYLSTFDSRHPMARFIAPGSAYHAIGNDLDRKAHSFWLPVVAAGAIVGMLIALSALLVKTDSQRRQQNRIPATSR